MSERFRIGVHVMTYGATWPEVAAVGQEIDRLRLRLPAHARPPARDAGRPLSAVLRELHDARRLGGADKAGPPGPPHRRQPVPQPGRRRQGHRDPRPHQQRPDDPGAGRRIAARGVPAPRPRGGPVARRPSARARRIAVHRDPHPGRRGGQLRLAELPLRARQAPPAADAGACAGHRRCDAARRSACGSRRSTPTTGRCRSIRPRSTSTATKPRCWQTTPATWRAIRRTIRRLPEGSFIIRDSREEAAGGVQGVRRATSSGPTRAAPTWRRPRGPARRTTSSRA